MRDRAQSPRYWLAAAFLTVWSSAATAQAIDHARQYRACLGLVYRTPEDAFESALAWHGLGGGVAAQHCAALAQIQLRQYANAARRLEAAAQQLVGGGRISPADLLGQAANAWMLAGSTGEAKRALAAALKTAPGDPELLIDRARIAAEEGAFESALADLDTALQSNPEDDDAYAFKASALRRLDRMEDALTAATTALALNPDNPSARLERGLIRRQLDDAAGARDDWLAVAVKHAGTPAAETARSLLERLEQKKSP